MKKRICIVGIILSLVIFLIGCKNSPEPETIIYQVGAIGPAGGYIFYDCDEDNDSGNEDGFISTECGWRFLEAAPEDLDSTYPFGCYRTSADGMNIVAGTTFSIGGGKSNTETLVTLMEKSAYINDKGPEKGMYAAKACVDYSIDVDGVVYDDWYLPSGDELHLMYTNLQCKELGSFDFYSSYWSSSEASNIDPVNALAHSFYYSHNSNYPYTSLSRAGRCYYCKVRPVREFL